MFNKINVCFLLVNILVASQRIKKLLTTHSMTLQHFLLLLPASPVFAQLLSWSILSHTPSPLPSNMLYSFIIFSLIPSYSQRRLSSFAQLLSWSNLSYTPPLPSDMLHIFLYHLLPNPLLLPASTVFLRTTSLLKYPLIYTFSSPVGHVIFLSHSVVV